jgi:glutamate synthase (NADPH/NADH) small chain
MLDFTNVLRRERDKKEALSRVKDFSEIYKPFKSKDAHRQSNRCLSCGIPYCHNSCPLHNYIPSWLNQYAKSDLELAFNLSNEVSPFPEILGTICPTDKLCEGACTLSDGHGAVTIGSLEAQITTEGFNRGLTPKFTPIKSQRQVAIIGSGPAGLSCATFLLRAGVKVDIYDKYDRAGGLLVYGIPSFKLDKKKVSRRVKMLQNAGANFIFGSEVGRDIAFETLEKRYDAIFVGVGAKKGKFAGIENEQNISGLHLAMDFLTNVQKRDYKENYDDFINIDNKKVVVVGGGDTAMDCARTAVRLGAKSVQCVYRRDESSMPCSKKEYENAVEEGVEFIFNQAIDDIKVEYGNISSIELAHTTLSNNKVHVLENAKSSTLGADMIIYALGFDIDSSTFLDKSGINLDNKNRIVVDHNCQTSKNNVFAGGDVIRGASLAVEAAADGKKAAFGIIKNLGIKNLR